MQIDKCGLVYICMKLIVSGFWWMNFFVTHTCNAYVLSCWACDTLLHAKLQWDMKTRGGSILLNFEFECLEHSRSRKLFFLSLILELGTLDIWSHWYLIISRQRSPFGMWYSMNLFGLIYCKYFSLWVFWAWIFTALAESPACLRYSSLWAVSFVGGGAFTCCLHAVNWFLSRKWL